MMSAIDSVDLALQILSTIFTILGIVATIAGINCRDSVAAVVVRRLRSRKSTRLFKRKRNLVRTGRHEDTTTKKLVDVEKASNAPGNVPFCSYSRLSGSTAADPRFRQEQMRRALS
jgi:hypothetical protein